MWNLILSVLLTALPAPIADSPVLWTIAVDGSMVQLWPNPQSEKPSATEQGDVQLLIFSADWCGPCRKMEPIVAEMQARDFPVKIVDADQQPYAAILSKYKIAELPAYVLYYEGKPAEWSSGVHSRKWLVDWISRIQTERARSGPLTDPLNAEVFRKRHWELGRGTCGMLGCRIHGGGWVLR